MNVVVAREFRKLDLRVILDLYKTYTHATTMPRSGNKIWVVLWRRVRGISTKKIVKLIAIKVTSLFYTKIEENPEQDYTTFFVFVFFVRKADLRMYVCTHISRSTGILSHFVNLNIVTPEAFILGGEEHHVDVGSIINLVCIIEKSPTPPQYVFWYHNNRMINYDTTRGSVTVQTDPGPTQSRLTIRQAVESDTGNYTCSASNTKPASIFVFVTEAKRRRRCRQRHTRACLPIFSHEETCLQLRTLINFLYLFLRPRFFFFHPSYLHIYV
ncbi:unnamed protein product [Trichogramma brassicae]|uniref:Ig-like domain-containing protein n=1 Tax=Trichogramma brassicae TaxID=86971 RepID=A0A6H5J4B2_9HYME|nr:unnamed protein product [Trichogramma brassicae]